MPNTFLSAICVCLNLHDLSRFHITNKSKSKLILFEFPEMELLGLKLHVVSLNDRNKSKKLRSKCSTSDTPPIVLLKQMNYKGKA